MNKHLLRSLALSVSLAGALGVGLVTGTAASAAEGNGEGGTISSAVHSATPEFGPCENNGVRAYRFLDRDPASAGANGHSYDFLLSVFAKGGRPCAADVTAAPAASTGTSTGIVQTSTAFIDTSGTGSGVWIVPAPTP